MKKKISFLVVAVVALILGIAIGAQAKQAPKVDIENPLAATVEHQQEDIDSLKSRNDRLSGNLDALQRQLEKNWRFQLGEIDDALDAVERGDTRSVGSYTDWFVPTLQDLKARGVGTWRLQQRIDRLVALAEQKKYLSSFEEEIIAKSGIDGLRHGANAILQ